MDFRIATRPVPFDADVGPDSNGRAAVVYSRCRRETSVVSTFSSLPQWRFARGCDLYRLSLISGQEQRLTQFSRLRTSETLPTLWRSNVAFAAVNEPAGKPRASVPRLAIGNRATGRERTVRGGSTGQIVRPAAREAATDGPGATAADLRGSALTFAWEFIGKGCFPADPGGDDPLDGPRSTQIWRTTSSSARLVSNACDANGVSAATFAGARVAWLQRTAGNALVDVRFDSGNRFSAPAPLVSISADGETLVGVQANASGAYDVVRFAARRVT